MKNQQLISLNREDYQMKLEITSSNNLTLKNKDLKSILSKKLINIKMKLLAIMWVIIKFKRVIMRKSLYCFWMSIWGKVK